MSKTTGQLEEKEETNAQATPIDALYINLIGPIFVAKQFQFNDNMIHYFPSTLNALDGWMQSVKLEPNN